MTEGSRNPFSIHNFSIAKQQKTASLDTDIKDKEMQLANLKSEIKSRQKLLESLNKIVIVSSG